ncbi:RecQ family ATP-dependent DNA helicase [Ramlibacter monticola]|uniref:DNA 3'-5' helicase n=2 Tax=Ramlibacter monticola TaxID=1926872 RepID=A0A936YZ33_9BURK|nr:RecQ family ATP-dependent DNA helicase [Ramlibacter monticola]MBL0391588.1 RecQ family ATP-dependent DNA helicase [Ramlibacter monticola]
MADHLCLATGAQPAAVVASRVNAVAGGARVLVGHNLLRHDLPQLRRQYPGLACLDLPVIDTLEWSALAFPTNPYHRLVKGYKLVSDTRNDPLKDARITLDLLREEVEAFAAMHASDSGWVALLHFLVARDGPLDQCLLAVRGAPAPEPAVANRLASQRFASKCCATRLARIAERDLVDAPDHRNALALALGWIRVSGGNSVLPVWVHKSLPQVRGLIGQLREQDCGDSACGYCREQHNPERLLKLHFGHAGFRPLPAAPDGTSLQRAIVAAGLAHRSLLAVLPTGGGKSICYQLPALAHYWRCGQLTVIVSPLQSLMKDQVDNLVKAGVSCAVTINGLLTPIERRAALDKIRLGDAGIVLVSPEQFRSRAFVEAIGMREIAAWVFDEAHCLSKWGHDFRTDYLYVARFVRESSGGRPAPVACFTATAKPDVIDDLCGHFRDALGLELERFLGGHERSNLTYQVIPATKAEKSLRIVEILQHELRDGGAGVIFCATKKAAETMAELVTAQGMSCGCFHGGLEADAKKTVQQRFLDGELAVIAATNAFGMGVDKPDIRVVVHAQIPGSLENYLQEAGRAGRDGAPARCVLLFDPEDVETQFRLSASSKLTQKDFTSLLAGVRQQARRVKSQEVVVSAKELLAASDATDIDIDSPDATTKVTTAVAWLERGGFLRRNENNTRVFPASLRVVSLDEAIQRIEKAQLAGAARARYVAVATTLFRSADPAGVSTDELMLDSGIEPQECFRILHQLEALGIITNDLGVSVRLAKGVKGAADKALERLNVLEQELLALMAQEAPDADAAGEPQVLNIRPVCTELRRRMGLNAGDAHVTPDRILACLRSMSESFGSSTQKRSLLRMRGREAVNIVLHRAWRWIRDVCERRRSVAQVVLHRLLEGLPAGARGADLVVECKAKDLLDAIESDMELQHVVKEPAAALEHALLYLHDNGVLQLDRGRSVFRSAMTIALNPDAAPRFTKEDFAPLEEFYRERTLQTHVMHEYARLSAEDPDRALALVDAYFTLPRRRFVREYFRGRADLLELATTDESFRRIVDELKQPVQQRLVESPERGNHLVLAGPGSGKTRVIVHRIAYLLRVRRVSPESIIALAFNRNAAAELRRRLLDLAGEDARRVTVLTYHAMALRLTGTSLEAAARLDARIDFDQLIQDAIDLLNGTSDAFMDADEARDRLLQGYEHIFVDEYQDIDEKQYQLVGALAGRRANDPDAKLNIMAVGDDDQNIYSFKGASVEFIRRFRSDYAGEVTYLVENFRSTQNIIAAANHVIQRAADRMKVDHPIRIDQARSQDPAGGRWESLDPLHGGLVRSMAAPGNSNLQAQVVMQEIQRILAAAPETSLSRIAVLARTHRALEPLRALCEDSGTHFDLISNEGARSRVGFMQLREGRQTTQQLPERRSELVRLPALRHWLAGRVREEPDNPYWRDIASALDECAQASQVEQVPAQEVLDVLHEAANDARRGGRPDALRLVTAHGAKGLEFDHVIVMDCGDWHWHGDDDRRLLYVAMTRARLTLVVMRAEDGANPCLSDLGSVEGVADVLPATRPTHRSELDRRYVILGPADVDLGYAGRLAVGDPVHAAIAGVRVGDEVRVDHRQLHDRSGEVVGRLAKKCELPTRPLSGKVFAVMVRTRTQSSADFQQSVKVDWWEVPLAEVVVP